MVNSQRVVVVDGPEETQQVLKAVFEPRGVQVDRVRSGSDGDAESAQVVVLHDNAVVASRTSSTSRVLIGRARPGSESPGDCRIDEPFHYADLVRAVETLLHRDAA